MINQSSERRICLPRFNRASNKTNTGGDRPAPYESFDNMPFDDDFGDRDKAELGELLGGGLPTGNSSGFNEEMPLFDDSLPPVDQTTAASRRDDGDLRRSFGVLFKAISDRIKEKKEQPSPAVLSQPDGFDDDFDDRSDHFVGDDFSDSPQNENHFDGYPDSVANRNDYGGYPDSVANGNDYGGYPDIHQNGYPESSDTWSDGLSETPAFGDGFDDTLAEPMLPPDDSQAKSLSVGARLYALFVRTKDKLSHGIKKQSVADDGVSFDDHGEFSDFIEWEEQGQETEPQGDRVEQPPKELDSLAQNKRENPPFEGEYGTNGNEVGPNPDESYPYASASKEMPTFWRRHGADEMSVGQDAHAEHDRPATPIGRLLEAVGYSWRKFRRRLPSFKPKVYTVSVPDYQPEEDGIQAPSLVSDIEKIIQKQSELGDVEREYEEMRSYIRSVDVNTVPSREEIAPPENIHEVREAENELFDLIRQMDVQNEQQRSRIGIYDAPPEEDPYNYRGINDNRQTYDDIEDASFDMRPRLSFESEQRIDPNRQRNERQAFGSPFDLRSGFSAGASAMPDSRSERFEPRQHGVQENVASGGPASPEGRSGRFAPRQRNAQENVASGGPASPEGRSGRFAPRQRSAQENVSSGGPASPEGRSERFAPRQRNAQENVASGGPASQESRSGRFAPRQHGVQEGQPVRRLEASLNGDDAPREKRKAKVRKRRNMADW